MLKESVIDRLVERYALSDAQREAGNYKKKHIRLHGLDISSETCKGKRRRPEWPAMPCDYGYIKGTMARDGDHVDVFVGPDHESDLVVVVDQVTPTGRFDEHKTLIGFNSEAEAIACYKSAYTPGWKVGPVTTMTIKQFKNWLDDGDTKSRLEPQVSRYAGKDQFGFDFAEMDHEPVSAKSKKGSLGGMPKPNANADGYRVVGISRDMPLCMRCFRMDLDKTLMVQPFENGEPVGGIEYYGSDCVEKVLGRSTSAIMQEALMAEQKKLTGRYSVDSDIERYAMLRDDLVLNDAPI